MFPGFGAVVAGGSSLLSGILGRKAQNKANAQSLELARQNIQLQRDFAQHGIRWKVDDAKAAGIHPLYALGANTHSFSPVSAGMTPEDGLAQGMANMGQNLGSAIERTRTANERHESKIRELQVERGELENTLLRSQINALNAPHQVGPPGPGTASVMPGEHDETDRAFGWHRYKKGINRGFLNPPTVDEHGNRLIYTAPGEYTILPYGVHPAERAEDLLGEVGGIPHQLGVAGQSAYDYVDRLLLEDLRANWNKASHRWKRFWRKPDLGRRQ